MIGTKRRDHAAGGFTLLEMAIVIAIISVLVGGILTGRSLIENANIRSVIRESQAYIAAVRLFKQKYIYLPGDMPNATSLWGAAASGSACATTIGTGTQTCDGNGDGFIGYQANSIEYFRAWQHLANAGLIAGSFSGIDYAGQSSPNWGVGGFNIPNSSFRPGAYYLSYFPATSGNPYYFDGANGTMLQLAGFNVSHNDWFYLTPQQAKLIDLKTDDGKPATGNVTVYYKMGSYNCTVDNTQNTDYNIAANTHYCDLMFTVDN